MERSDEKMPDCYFNDDERGLIRRAVAEAESKSSGEIAVMVVPESDRYPEAEKLGAVLLAGLVSLVVSVAVKHVTIWTYIPLVFLLFFPAHFIFRRFPRLKLSVAGAARQAEAVRERALASFYQKGLYRTREETGVLIFISLLERKVWILGDRGINEKIAPDHWRSLAGRLATGMRTGKATEALCCIIAECGNELARHFPSRPDDTNELSNDVLS